MNSIFIFMERLTIRETRHAQGENLEILAYSGIRLPTTDLTDSQFI